MHSQSSSFSLQMMPFRGDLCRTLSLVLIGALLLTSSHFTTADDNDVGQPQGGADAHPDEQQPIRQAAQRAEHADVRHQAAAPIDAQQQLHQQQGLRPQAQQQDVNRPKPDLNRQQVVHDRSQQQAAAGGEGARARQPPAGRDDGEKHVTDFAECADDVNKYCASLKQAPDLAILECLMDAGQVDKTSLSGACEHVVWQFKVNFTRDARFEKGLDLFCKAEMASGKAAAECLKETKPGYKLSCLLDHLHEMQQDDKCHKYLTRVERLAFTDFRLVGPFVDKCGSAIETSQCGSISMNMAQMTQQRTKHTQGDTVQCLIEFLVEKQKGDKTLQDKLITPECRKEIMRIAELQADDYHLDRPLFFACREDRELFCHATQAGQGRIFECLMQHKDDQRMHPKCRHTLGLRAQMLGRNYRISPQLAQACEADLKTHRCLPEGDDSGIPSHYYLSYVILCLENAAHSSPQKLNADCDLQLREHRELMLSEYRLSPELVLSCSHDIDVFCNGTVEGGGKTMSCLMQHAVHQRQDVQAMSPECVNALATVVKAADIGTSYKVDRVLMGSCRNLIEGVCSRDAGESEAATLSCLMQHIDDDTMADACEERLLEIQYFMARDWALDPRLYKACHRQAATLCSAGKDWHHMGGTEQGADAGPVVLACLYRHAYSDDEPSEVAGEKLDAVCTTEVRRVLRERASRVALMPEIEENCRPALAEYCSKDKKDTQPGEELDCLQEYFEDEDFKKRHRKCYDALAEFTKKEAVDTRLNRALTQACKPVIQTHCQHLRDEEIDHGDVVECLVQNKKSENMNKKCLAYVNHFELISMRDYHFSHVFKRSCTEDIRAHCAQFGPDKSSVIRCLSEVMFKHRVLNDGKGLSKKCAHQLKVSYLQVEEMNASEGEKVAPVLWKDCKTDLNKFQCLGDGFNVEDVVECLRTHMKDLQPACKALVFQREEIEAVDNTLDAKLIEDCHKEIQHFCEEEKIEHPDSILDCLRMNMNKKEMSKRCHKTIILRLKEHSKDIRLQPGLFKACESDLKDLCPREDKILHDKQYEMKDLEGAAVSCLRAHLTSPDKATRPSIKQDCRNELHKIILESETDPELDPTFYHSCLASIKQFCSEEILGARGHGGIMECVKSAYYKNQITDKQCRKELRTRTSVALSDIHLDPFLFESCSLDLKHYCADIRPGNGRLVQCLMDGLQSTNARISNECRAKLEDRRRLWAAVAKDDQLAVPEDVSELLAVLGASPARGSFLFYGGILFACIAVVFCFCGRASKRIRREIKNR